MVKAEDFLGGLGGERTKYRFCLGYVLGRDVGRKSLWVKVGRWICRVEKWGDF